jgi:tRNA threonylcarbamoyladenosine biosynthesis protein TsaE
VTGRGTFENAFVPGGDAPAGGLGPPERPAGADPRLEVRLTEDRLVAWGERVGRTVELPAFLAIRGPVGAGKSTLARAVARGAGVAGSIPSPTFNLLLRYSSERAEVQHLDLYRLEEPDEVWELGWEELGTGSHLVLVEWPERVEHLLPADRWDVSLEETGDPARRLLRVLRLGSAPAVPPLPEDDG